MDEAWELPIMQTLNTAVYLREKRKYEEFLTNEYRKRNEYK